jgi:Protein of unknown function (DUF2817)
MVTSACHGVEGYCGSGVQVHALADAQLREKAKAQGVAIVYLHALNPHGFSFDRRVTHENVDLNRNAQDFSKPLPRNAAYADIHDLLLPEVWPPNAQNTAAVDDYLATKGLKAFQQATSQGQHEFADGLFFGGTAPTWSQQTFRSFLREHMQHAKAIGWIDLHTGLGPSGHGERICAGPNDPVRTARTRAWWDGGGQSPITSIYDGSSASAELTGLIWGVADQECAHAEITSIALEYGTLDVMQVLAALRADHWLHRESSHGRLVEPALVASIRQGMRDAFYTDTDPWKGQIVSQARQAMFQGLDALGDR